MTRLESSAWRENIPRTDHPIKFLTFASKPYRWWSTLAFGAVFTGATLNAFSSYVYKLIVDAAVALPTQGMSALWWAAALFIIVSLISTLAWRASGFFGARWMTGVRATTRYALTAHVIRHDYQYFSDRFAGSISSKISNASNSMKEIAEQILWQFSPFVITLVASFFVIYSTNHLIAYLFLAWAVLITPLNIYFARRRSILSTAAQKAETKLTGSTVDILTNISAVHEYVGRLPELRRLQEIVSERRKLGLRNWFFGESVLLLNGLLQFVFVSGMILLAVYLVSIGLASPGDIVLVLATIVMVEDRLTFIGSQLNSFGDSWGQVKEGLEDILQPHGIVSHPNARELLVINATLSFDRVSFDYGGMHVLNELSLRIPAGQKVGLVGKSGAGKSTLAKLILRHHELTAGAITINGVSIADVTLESLRNAIGVVPQEPLLFHRTIRENIAYGKPSAIEEEIVQVAKDAQAHEFIINLPSDYDSLVGERGVKLSGGQRQRVAIARAMLKNAPILLLDEATSSLDSGSEAAVQKALLALMEGRTVIAIAHRLSTLRAMDRIVVLDEGKIVEDGTHEELLARGGIYAELWSHQAGGFLE